jgi:hypothetical protein
MVIYEGTQEATLPERYKDDRGVRTITPTCIMYGDCSSSK